MLDILRYFKESKSESSENGNIRQPTRPLEEFAVEKEGMDR